MKPVLQHVLHDRFVMLAALGPSRALYLLRLICKIALVIKPSKMLSLGLQVRVCQSGPLPYSDPSQPRPLALALPLSLILNLPLPLIPIVLLLEE